MRKKGDKGSSEFLSVGWNLGRTYPFPHDKQKQARQLAEAQMRKRKEPTQSIDVAIEALHKELNQAGDLYRSPVLQDQRDAVAAALLTVSEFLISQGFQALAVDPLVRPVLSLTERENNSIDLLFAERKKGGRPKKTLTEHYRTGFLAAMAELWLMSHANEEGTQAQKLGRAARALKGPYFGNVTKANIDTAREIVSQEAKDHPAVEHADMCRQWAKTTIETFGQGVAFPALMSMFNTSPPSFAMGSRGVYKTPHVSSNEPG